MNVMNVKGSLVLAGAVIGISAALAGLQAAGLVDEGIVKRGVGAVLGLIVIAYANQMPKILVPLDEPGDPARRQGLQRFAGWTLVLGGIGYVSAFLFAPMAWAAPLAVACGVTALIIVFARCLALRRIV